MDPDGFFPKRFPVGPPGMIEDFFPGPPGMIGPEGFFPGPPGMIDPEGFFPNDGPVGPPDLKPAPDL